VKEAKSNAALQLFGYIPEPVRISNPALKSGGLGLSMPVRSDVPDMPSKGFLKVQAYVHNRITICSYWGGSKRVPKRLMHRDLNAMPSAVSNFNILRKTRRELKVGGRWREKCLETSFTSRAKNMLRDAGYLIETEATGVGLFLTLTIAGGTEDVFEAVGIASGYIVDRFNRWLRYKVDNGWFGYVWELQDRGAPHLHYMFRMQAGTNFVSFYREARNQWRRILLDVSEESGVDLFAKAGGGTHRENPNLPVINFRKIKTCISGYLAKYASKERTKGGTSSPFVPGRWWGVSYAIRREVLLRRLSFVFGCTTVERATNYLSDVVERLGTLIKSSWRAPNGETGPGEFLSIVINSASAVSVAAAIRDWIGGGDLTEFDKLVVVSNAVRAAPA
jgi:hypothetical protein